jgi:hypothetical protein
MIFSLSGRFPHRERELISRVFALLVVFAALPLIGRSSVPVASDFPQFLVPGRAAEMDSLRALYWLHYQPAGPIIPLWDEWMPKATLWPARAGDQSGQMRRRWAEALANRPMSDEGYVLTMQHDGPAHADGWPFPTWQSVGGIGWHFRGTGIRGYDAPTVGTDGWEVSGGTMGDIDAHGLVVELTGSESVLLSPRFAIAARTSPWLRLNAWGSGLEGAPCFIEWTTREHPDFSAQRSVAFAAPAAEQEHRFLPMGGNAGKVVVARGEARVMIPVYRHAEWRGEITRLRLRFRPNAGGVGRLVVKSFHTACDTRHNVNNANFIRGCHDYYLWTGDQGFLRAQMPRIRAAMRFIQREFDTRRRLCVYTTWPGHEGRSGVRWVEGRKEIVRGEGIGSNYWDLLPFGGEDALATVYYYDALGDLATLEEVVAAHPEWGLSAVTDAFDPADLRAHCRDVQAYGTRRFWNPETGRFGTVDLDGVMHDYGFTFLNNEAVYHDFATAEQAAMIHAWLAGERAVMGDDSTGSDIYHWRFGPRSTTRRNLDYYFWGWSNADRIPWGYQVQDGGAVLGWSYHDLMARLKTAGPDDCWARLAEILRWFDEAQLAGGYRAYYAQDRGRGTMQGGNVAGGLGVDTEFFESILVPNVMLYGFLGFQPTADGCVIAPRLPRDWPSLTITRVHLRDRVMTITAEAQTKTITVDGVASTADWNVSVAAGWILIRK